MKRYSLISALFSFCFLFLDVSFAAIDYRHPFFIYLPECYQSVIPKFNKDIRVFRSYDKFLKCEKISADFIQCDIAEKDKSYFQIFYLENKNKDFDIFLSDKKEFNIYINSTNRVSLSSQTIESPTFIDVYSCKGLFVDQNFIKKLKKIDLNKGMDFILSEVKRERKN